MWELLLNVVLNFNLRPYNMIVHSMPSFPDPLAMACEVQRRRKVA
jgi:hypothetical protein